MAKTDCQNRLRVIMADKRLTNAWLAKEMGLSDITISRWRSNKMQPSIAQLAEMAHILQVEVQDLLEIKYIEDNQEQL